jgi:hypothetical protein
MLDFVSIHPALQHRLSPPVLSQTSLADRASAGVAHLDLTG